jgi:hypothetical protein
MEASMPSETNKLWFQLNLTPKDTDEDAQTLAVLFLDASGDFELEDSERVTLVTANGRTWVGTTELDRPPAGTLFNVRFVAPVGTKWGFNAKTEGGKVLYELDEQTTVTPVEQLGGVLK